MSIKVVTTSISKPPKIIIFGKPGTGKSRFAAGMPRPFFIRTEDRHDHLAVESHEGICDSYMMLLEILDWLLTEKHPYKSVVLDTADSAEKIVHAYVCARAGAASILDPKVLPYYAGFKQAAIIWETEILPRLTRLNDERRMLPCIVSHVTTAHIMHPVYGDYPQFTLGVEASKNGLASKVYKWADIVGFLDWETTTVGKEETGNLRLRSTEQRVLRLRPAAGWDTKESYNLPASVSIPTDAPGELSGWPVLAAAIKQGIATRATKGNLSEVKTEQEAKRLTEPKAANGAK